MMEINRKMVADQLTRYLQQQITLAELVDWAESAMMEGEFVEEDFELIRDVITRIGVADVRAFGLTWEDCQNLLTKLGYQAQVTVYAAD